MTEANEALEMARSAVAQGDTDRVLALFERHACGADGASRMAWALLLVEAGWIERAQEQLATLPPELRARVERVLADGENADCAREECVPARKTGEGEDDPYAVGDEVVRPRATEDRRAVETFLRWFGGRRDVYAKAWYDERRRRAGYHPVEQPLTEAVVRAHLQGAMTVGQYLLHPDATCSFGVIDLDVAGAAMEALRACHGGGVSALEHPPAREAALRLIDAGSRLGIPLFPEDSGGRGVHLWAFFDPRRPAAAVRSVLSQVLVACGPLPPDVQPEVYPKQDKLGPRGLSSLVKLPLGVHPATARRCDLLDDQLRPIADPVAAMDRLRVSPVDAVDAVVGRRVVPLPAPELEPCEAVPRLVEQKTPRSLAETLRAIAPGPEGRAAAERVVRGCAVLASIVRKAYDTHALEAAEARAIVYTLGLLGAEPGLADEVLAAARFPRRELDRVRRGLPSPMGCSKLRTLAAGTPPCACFDARTALPYATPVLHAVGPIAPSEPRWKPFAPFLDTDGDIVRHPLEQIGETLNRIERRLEVLESKDR